MELSKAKSLALSLMWQHKLDGWSFKFDNARRRMGVCKYGPKVIALSCHLVTLNEESEVRDTILHEIAHALTPGAHHGRMWQLTAQAIGARPQACVSTDRITIPSGRWQAVCAGCKKVYHKYRKPTAKRARACARCCKGHFDAQYILNFVEVQ